MDRLSELLKKLETGSVVYDEIDMKDNFVLMYHDASDDIGLWLKIYCSKNHSFDNRCEEISISYRNKKEILELVKETKLRYLSYSRFMNAIGFRTVGNGLYLGELNTIEKGKKLLTVSFKFLKNKNRIKIEEGWHETPSHYRNSNQISCETNDFIGFVSWYLKLVLPMEEMMKLPREARDLILENEFNAME